MLKLIEDLGAETVNAKTGAKACFGIYKCTCGDTMHIRHTVANRKVTQCRKCGALQRNVAVREKTQHTIIEKFKEVHGNRYAYSNVVYTRNIDKVVIGCSIHGDFLQSPKNHKNGQGCPECAKTIRSIKLRTNNTHRSAYLYYVYFPSINLYKIGVTVSLKHRFRGEIHKHMILYSKKFNTEQEAYYVENLLLTDYNAYKYIGPNVLHRKGNTELLTKNILTDLQLSVETIESTQKFKNLSGSE